MSLQNLVRLSGIKTFSLHDHACPFQQSVKKMIKKRQLMSSKLMIGYDIYDRFTMEHFPLRQNMILTTSFFLLATVQLRTRNFRRQIYVNSKYVNVSHALSL
jgi:hypothetical protein